MRKLVLEGQKVKSEKTYRRKKINRYQGTCQEKSILIRSFLIFCFILIAVPSCSKSGKKMASNPARGKVLLGDQPLAGALVVLVPKTGADLPGAVKPSGETAQDGTFELTSYKPKDGAPEGEYKVIISKFDDDTKTHTTKSLLPPLYANPETTPFSATIQKGSNELTPFVIGASNNIGGRGGR